MNSCGWVRHRSGGVGLRSERPGITGPWGHRRRGTSGPARSRVQLWERRSVHRLAKTASRRRFGAFVYTVGLWAWVVGGLGIAIVYTNGRIGPLGAGLGHSCTLLGREGRASCNASCIGWHEHPNHHGMPAAPPRWPPLPWSRKQALRDRLCVSGAIVRLVSSQNVNPHKPPRSVTQTREEARKTQRNICRVRFPDGSTLR